MTYRPANARGEDNLHNYLGMCAVPLEASITYPEKAPVVDGPAKVQLITYDNQTLILRSDLNYNEFIFVELPVR